MKHQEILLTHIAISFSLEVHALPLLELNNRVFIFWDNLTIYIKILKKKNMNLRLRLQSYGELTT